MNSYFLIVTNADGNELGMSLCVGCSDNSVNLLVDNLNLSSFYKFIIKSNNSIGEQSATAASFCKQYINFRIIILILSFSVDKCLLGMRRCAIITNALLYAYICMEMKCM